MVNSYFRVTRDANSTVAAGKREMFPRWSARRAFYAMTISIALTAGDTRFMNI